MLNYANNPEQYRKDVAPLIALPGQKRNVAAQKAQAGQFRKTYTEKRTKTGSVLVTKERHRGFMYTNECVKKNKADAIFDRVWGAFSEQEKLFYGKKCTGGGLIPRIPKELNKETVELSGTQNSKTTPLPEATGESFAKHRICGKRPALEAFGKVPSNSNDDEEDELLLRSSNSEQSADEQEDDEAASQADTFDGTVASGSRASTKRSKVSKRSSATTAPNVHGVDIPPELHKKTLEERAGVNENQKVGGVQPVSSFSAASRVHQPHENVQQLLTLIRTR